MTAECTCCERRPSAPGKYAEWCSECISGYVEAMNA